MGRPKLPAEQLKQYKRVAVYPQTHQKIKILAKSADENILDWFDAAINVIENDEEIQAKINDYIDETKQLNEDTTQ